MTAGLLLPLPPPEPEFRTPAASFTLCDRLRPELGVEGLKLDRNAASLSRLLPLEAKAFCRRGLPEEERGVGEKGEFERVLGCFILLPLGLRKFKSGENAASRPDKGEDGE